VRKFFIFILLALAATSSFAKTPDILTYSRTDKEWNVFLLDEFRMFMDNVGITGIDPKNIELSDPLIYSEESVRKYVTDDLHNVLERVGDIVGLSYASIKPKLIVNDFAYSVRKFEPTITPSEDSDGNVTLKSTIEVTGLAASARDISLEFEVEGLSKKPTVRIIKPTIVLKRGAKIDFDMAVKFVEDNNEMKVELSQGNFSRITEMLTQDHDLIDIIFDEKQIEFPDIRGSFAGRELVLNHQRIIDIIVENKANLKVLLFDQLHELFKQNLAEELLKSFDNIVFKSDRWIKPTGDAIFPIYLKVVDFSNPFGQIFLAELGGDFCTTRNYVAFGDDCINNRITKTPIDVRTKADLQKSKDLIENAFKTRPDMKFVASVSENYINKAIVTTYDFGLWEPILKEMGASLDEKKILVKLDETGTKATIILDIHYELGKWEGRAVREKFVRFPAILKANVRVENNDVDGEKMAQIVFNVYDVVLDDEILKYGHKEYGFPSNVHLMRKIFIKKVIKMMKAELFDYDAETARERVGKWSGIDLPPVDLPEINNMHLEKMHLESDGHGRVNIILEGDTPSFRRRSRRL
jgi:hypothetical protein